MGVATRRPLELTVEAPSPEKVRTGALVVGAFADGTLPPPTRKIDEASKGRTLGCHQSWATSARSQARRCSLLRSARRRGRARLARQPGSPRPVRRPGVPRRPQRRCAAPSATGAARDAAVTLADVDVPGRSLAWRLQHASRLLADGAYRFNFPCAAGDAQNETRQRRAGTRSLALLIAEPGSRRTIEAAIRRGHAIAEGMALARDLGNLPGNICNPPYLAETARSLGQEFEFEVEVLEREDMRKLGMGAALAVGQASAQPCKFIVMHYKGGGRQRAADRAGRKGRDVRHRRHFAEAWRQHGRDEVRHVRRGKRVRRNQDGRPSDGCRSTSWVSSPAVENMPGGNATRPGDVVTSMSGQTIEILNTDAEGRLALADALTYAERFYPACVIDVATLTGACVIALGNITSGLLRQRRRACRRVAAMRQRLGRSRLASADVRRVSGSAQKQFRGHEQPWRTSGGHHHGGVLSRPLREGVQVGAPRYRGYQCSVRRRQGRHRPAGAAADRVSDRARQSRRAPGSLRVKHVNYSTPNLPPPPRLRRAGQLPKSSESIDRERVGSWKLGVGR